VVAGEDATTSTATATIVPDAATGDATTYTPLLRPNPTLHTVSHTLQSTLEGARTYTAIVLLQDADEHLDGSGSGSDSLLDHLDRCITARAVAGDDELMLASTLLVVAAESATLRSTQFNSWKLLLGSRRQAQRHIATVGDIDPPLYHWAGSTQIAAVEYGVLRDAALLVVVRRAGDVRRGCLEDKACAMLAAEYDSTERDVWFLNESDAASCGAHVSLDDDGDDDDAGFDDDDDRL